MLAHEKLLQSKLLTPNANRRIQSVDNHVGFVGAGLLADSRHLVSRAREEASNYCSNYDEPIPGPVYCIHLDDCPQSRIVRRCVHAVLISASIWFMLNHRNS